MFLVQASRIRARWFIFLPVPTYFPATLTYVPRRLLCHTEKHADLLSGALSHGHAHVLRYLKWDNPSQHKVIERAIVSKSALMHEIQQIYKQTQMCHLKYTPWGISVKLIPCTSRRLVWWLHHMCLTQLGPYSNPISIMHTCSLALCSLKTKHNNCQTKYTLDLS